MISGALPTPADLAARIAPAEHARLLGYPDRRIPAGPVRRRAGESRDWYARNGQPWAFASVVRIRRIADSEVRLANGERFAAPALARRLARTEASALVVVAVSAGVAVDRRSRRLWLSRRPDEAYLLDRFAAAVVEHLAADAGSRLRRLARDRGLGLLPGIGPGHEGWDVGQQARVARCLTGVGGAPPPRTFQVLASGMIRPKSSLLAVFGLTSRTDLADTAWRRRPCGWCSAAACGFRRPEAAGDRRRPPRASAVTYDRLAEPPA